MKNIVFYDQVSVSGSIKDQQLAEKLHLNLPLVNTAQEEFSLNEPHQLGINATNNQMKPLETMRHVISNPNKLLPDEELKD